MHVVVEGPGAILWVLRYFLCLISRLRWHPTPVFLPGETQGWGTRWAAVYGVAQSQTRLKRLSSSSSSSYITSGWRLAQGTLSAPFWCQCQKLSLSLLYFNKTLLHKSSQRSSLVTGPGLNSSSLETKNPGVFRGSATNFCFQIIWIWEMIKRIEDDLS